MWTLEELITETWEQIGKPSDITPLDLDGNFDVNLDGSQQIKKWVNWGLRQICTWKFNTGELVRFSSLYRRTRFETRPYEVEVVGYDAGSGVVTLAEDLPEWIKKSHMAIKANLWQEVVPISDNELRVIPIRSDVPVGETGVHRREYFFMDSTAPGAEYNVQLSPVSEIDSVQRLTDLEYGREIARGTRTEYYPTSRRQQSPAMAYFNIGNGISFDRIPEENRWFMLEYYALPTDLEEAGDYPEIPAQFHEAIILHATWFGLRRQQEWSGAYSTKRDLFDFMQSRRKQFESSFDYSDGYLRIE